MSNSQHPAESEVRIACLQMEPKIGDKDANLARSLELIEKAAAAGANLVVLPELCNTGYVFETREEAFGLAEEVSLRVGGLLWPEARERLALGTWLAVDSRGSGQVVLFASSPTFRGFYRGTARLVSNAAIYGPGLGARQPLGW